MNPNDPSDLNDSEASVLWNNLIQIMAISNDMAERGVSNSQAHKIYVLARDCRDLLAFDQQSRQVIKNLTHSDPVVNGLPLSETVRDFVLRGMKINAIKELRTETGCALKEAKDAVEAWERTL
jgi:ribosomal protein L7/L12